MAAHADDCAPLHVIANLTGLDSIVAIIYGPCAAVQHAPPVIQTFSASFWPTGGFSGHLAMIKKLPLV